MSKMLSVVLIFLFGGFFIYALFDGNKTGIITTGLVFITVIFVQLFNLVPRIKRWNTNVKR